MSQVLTATPPPYDRRITYGPEPLQFIDLRMPDGPGPHPGVIAIHGGFWRNRYSLDHLGHLCAALTARSVVTASIEYRRIGDLGGAWPGTLRDVADAARAILRESAAIGLDPERVVVIGHSAGGHLATWLASHANVSADSLVRSEPVPLLGAVSLAGVVDLEWAWERRLGEFVVNDLLGGGPDDVPERYAAASPIRLVPAGSPQVLLHGELDDIVPVEISRRYHEAATAAGGTSTLTVLPGADHFDVIDPESDAFPAVASAVLGLLGIEESSPETTPAGTPVASRKRGAGGRSGIGGGRAERRP